MAERIFPNPKSSGLQGPSAGHESDLAELAALFAEHSGGSFSPEVAADLALDIVLGEIVEQAGHATGATGAAILFEREGELVCRASRGALAPEMGARLNLRSGLTGECIRTQEVLRCDDALIDSRADTEASRALGVRSVVIVPLIEENGLAGILEIFSPRADAFDEQDEIMLEALAVRTLKNVDRARQVAEGSTTLPHEIAAPISPVHEDTAPAHFEESAELQNIGPPDQSRTLGEETKPENFVPALESEKTLAEAVEPETIEQATFPEIVPPEKEDAVIEETLQQNPPHGVNLVTVALLAAIVICAVLLATLVGLRMSGRRATRDRVPNAARAATSETSAPNGQSGVAIAAPAVDAGKVAAKKDPVKAPAENTTRSHEPVSQEGGLSVYENGKEVFRIPAAAQPTSALEPGAAVEGSQAPIHRVEPEYPESARQQGIQGVVVLDVRIGRNGGVQDVKVVSGPEVLADAAVAAVKQWKFHTQSVDAQTRVTLNFKMTQ